MPKGKIYTLNLTKIELQAAFVACSCYAPKDASWKEKAQSRAARKLEEAYLRMELL